MKIIDVNRIFYNVITKLICFTITDPGLYATTRHPNTITTRMMITTIIIFCQLSLAIICSSKLAAPYHKRFVEQAALVHVFEQRTERAIEAGRHRGVRQAAVLTLR